MRPFYAVKRANLTYLALTLDLATTCTFSWHRQCTSGACVPKLASRARIRPIL